MNEDELKLNVKFAATAQQVLNNPAYQAAITARKAELFQTFTETSADQIEERNEAWRTMQNLTALEMYFQDFLINGKIAEQALNEG